MNQSRRGFLRSSLTLALVSCAAPGRILALYPPSIREESGEVTAIYSIKLSHHPGLATIGGSIRLEGLDELQLNPDHCENNGWSRRNFPIAVTRVAESGEGVFTAVSTFCTHAFGFSVAFNESIGHFVCPHRGASFASDGSLLNGPARSDLRIFRTTFDGVDTIIIESVLSQCQIADVAAPAVPPSLMFLDQNVPNPARARTVIRYGLPEATVVELSIHSMSGQVIVVFQERQEAGIHFYELDVANLNSGLYHVRMTTGTSMLTRKLTVIK